MKLIYIFVLVILLNNCLAISVKEKAEVSTERAKTSDGKGGNYPKVRIQLEKDKDLSPVQYARLTVNLENSTHGITIDLADSGYNFTHSNIALNDQLKSKKVFVNQGGIGGNEYLIPFRFITNAESLYPGKYHHKFEKLSITNDAGESFTLTFRNYYRSFWGGNGMEMTEAEMKKFVADVNVKKNEVRSKIQLKRNELISISNEWKSTTSILEEDKNKNKDSVQKRNEFLAGKNKEIKEKNEELSKVKEEQTKLAGEIKGYLDNTAKLNDELVKINTARDAEITKFLSEKTAKETDFKKNTEAIESKEKALAKIDNDNQKLKTEADNLLKEYNDKNTSLTNEDKILQAKLKEIQDEIAKVAEDKKKNDVTKTKADAKKSEYEKKVAENDKNKKALQKELDDLNKKSEETFKKLDGELKTFKESNKKAGEDKQKEINAVTDKLIPAQVTFGKNIASIAALTTDIGLLETSKIEYSMLLLDTSKTQDQIKAKKANYDQKLAVFVTYLKEPDAIKKAEESKSNFNQNVKNLNDIVPKA